MSVAAEENARNSALGNIGCGHTGCFIPLFPFKTTAYIKRFKTYVKGNLQTIPVVFKRNSSKIVLVPEIKQVFSTRYILP